MELILIRHGECQLNDGTNGVDMLDPPLTERGWRQARYAGKRLAGSPVDVLYCGCLLRNLQTAQCLFEESGLVPRVLWSMFEAYYNQAARAWDAIGPEFPHFIVEPDCGAYPRETIETRAEAYARAKSMLAWLMNRHYGTDERVGIVSHGNFNAMLMDHCLGLPPCDHIRYSTGNCAFHHIRLYRGGGHIVKLNDEDHLPLHERS